MTKEDLSKLINECCDDIFDRKEPLANVKARLYYTLKKQLTLTDISKSFYCERQANLLKQCAIECDYCKSIRDI